jgi:hypothetical protein
MCYLVVLSSRCVSSARRPESFLSSGQGLNLNACQELQAPAAVVRANVTEACCPGHLHDLAVCAPEKLSTAQERVSQGVEIVAMLLPHPRLEPQQEGPPVFRTACSKDGTQARNSCQSMYVRARAAPTVGHHAHSLALIPCIVTETKVVPKETSLRTCYPACKLAWREQLVQGALHKGQSSTVGRHASDGLCQCKLSTPRALLVCWCKQSKVDELITHYAWHTNKLLPSRGGKEYVGRPVRHISEVQAPVPVRLDLSMREAA